ncbi:hypothetical protein V8E54_008199 [Elaphomyces granulatus]
MATRKPRKVLQSIRLEGFHQQDSLLNRLSHNYLDNVLIGLDPSVNNVIAECKGMTAIKNGEVFILDQELAAAREEIAQLKSRIKDKDTATLITEERGQFRNAYAQEAANLA